MQTPPDRPVLGVTLAFGTVLCWAQIPVLMKPLAAVLDPLTINWVRFVFAAVILLAMVTARGRAPRILSLWRHHPALALVLILGLAGNFVLYIFGLRLVSEVVCQTTIQLAPVLFSLASLYVFKERFTRWQWTGCIILAVGYFFFFRYRLLTIAEPGNLLAGVAVVCTSAVSWAAYALAQKKLQSLYTPLVLVAHGFLGCTLLLLPVTAFRTLARLDAPHAGLLLAASIASLAGYVSFVRAVEVWHASRVSALLTTTPIFTLILVAVATTLFPTHVAPSALPVPSVIGAFLVVGGAALTALARESARPPSAAAARSTPASADNAISQ